MECFNLLICIRERCDSCTTFWTMSIVQPVRLLICRFQNNAFHEDLPIKMQNLLSVTRLNLQKRSLLWQKTVTINPAESIASGDKEWPNQGWSLLWNQNSWFEEIQTVFGQINLLFCFCCFLLNPTDNVLRSFLYELHRTRTVSSLYENAGINKSRKRTWHSLEKKQVISWHIQSRAVLLDYQHP